MNYTKQQLETCLKTFIENFEKAIEKIKEILKPIVEFFDKHWFVLYCNYLALKETNPYFLLKNNW